MHSTTISRIFAFGLLAVAPLASAIAIPSQSQDLVKNSLSLETRHHTKGTACSFLSLFLFLFFLEENKTDIRTAQIAAKAKANGRDLTQDEIEEDEDDELLTSLAPGGEIEKRHHTKGTYSSYAWKGSWY
jgi:hypothetical protein